QTPNGALVISNKEPPPGSKIIRQHSWPDGLIAKSRKANSLLSSQTNRQEAQRSPPRRSRSSGSLAYNNGFKPVADCSLCRNRRRLLDCLHMESDSSLRLAS